jgi:hypothetical protein
MLLVLEQQDKVMREALDKVRLLVRMVLAVAEVLVE